MRPVSIESTFVFDNNHVRALEAFNEQLGVFLNVKQQKPAKNLLK